MGHSPSPNYEGKSLSTHHLSTLLSSSNSSPVHDFAPLFWTRQLLDTLWLKAQAIFDISNFMPIHTSCRSRDAVFFVWLYDESYLWIERYLLCVVEGYDLYKYIFVGQ